MTVKFDIPSTFNDMIEDMFRADRASPGDSTFPAIDIIENADGSVIIAEMPGLKEEDIKLSVEDGWLTISGERKPYEIPQNARVLLNEMRARNFSRSIELPHPLDTISAELNNGLLTITLQKEESRKAKEILIR